MTADISILRGGGGIINNNIMGRKGDKGEVIHSGHFMVSDFEAEAQDDEENVLLEIPGDTYDGGQEDEAPLLPLGGLGGHNYPQQQQHHHGGGVIIYGKKSKIETLSIDSSLTKLFNAMSICYR
ncbi:hypothetical protein Pcinc_035436 [Petrolisthes cinctipes]|uniref:Uncharacterized protein n=1 Tax=Petrolisthes cinctipes TaxID=88211 RepID=A0AAE1BYC1_PETCI|nr:hypothetical protein Pcinc_035436 [Petrolisthes cinctipes]